MSGARPASSAFLFLDDALAAGPDVLCAELDSLGFGGVTPAVAYHQASDLRLRGLPGHLADAPAGACYFPPRRGAAATGSPPGRPHRSTRSTCTPGRVRRRRRAASR
jgi:hypothetical protein